MQETTTIPLDAMMGDYPVTHALISGQLESPMLDLSFADVAVPNTAFKRTVRALEFDVSELAIVTYLQAFEAGVPLVLLPTVLVSRFQHPYLMHDTRRGALRPEDLRGKRIGVRSYAVTTVTWLRGMLLQDYGIQPSENEWITIEDAHVESWRDPANAHRAPAGTSLESLLEAGEIDAAVLAAPPNEHVKPVFDEQAAENWHWKHGVIQINHMMVLKRALCDQLPQVPQEMFRLLTESKARSGLSKTSRDDHPFGFEAVLPHLDHAIEMTHAQGLIKRRFDARELFHPATLL